MEMAMIKKKDVKKKKGFTLIEMVVVIAIIAILAGIAVPQALKAINRSKAMADIANAKSLATAISQAIAEGGTLTKDDGTITDPNTGNDQTLIQKYLSPIPGVKFLSSAKFMYSYDKNTLKIYVNDGTNNHQIYPNIDSNVYDSTGKVVANKTNSYNDYK